MHAIKMAVGLKALRAQGHANKVHKDAAVHGRPGVYPASMVEVRRVGAALRGQLHPKTRQAHMHWLAQRGLTFSNGQVLRTGKDAAIAIRKKRVGAAGQVFSSQAQKDAQIAADLSLINQLTDQVNSIGATAASLASIASAAQATVDGFPQDPPNSGTAADPDQQSLLDSLMSQATDANNQSSDANVQLAVAQNALADAQQTLADDQAAAVQSGGGGQPIPQPQPQPQPQPVPVVTPPAAGMSTGAKIGLAVAAAAVVAAVVVAKKKRKKH